MCGSLLEKATVKNFVRIFHALSSVVMTAGVAVPETSAGLFPLADDFRAFGKVRQLRLHSRQR
jgi:hypothetical protein